MGYSGARGVNYENTFEWKEECTNVHVSCMVLIAKETGRKREFLKPP